MNVDDRDAYMQAGIIVREHDGMTVSLALLLGNSIVMVIAEFIRLEDTLLIKGAQVEGRGLTRTLIRTFANVVGQIENVSRVIVQGGKRTSGGRAGSVPSPIQVEVQR